MIAAGFVLAGLIGLELSLRWIWGFGNPVLYLADPQTGYRPAPNQSVRRFGNRIEINAYSMRSSAIAPLPEPDTLRVLLLGDSIANGGWWTDQSEILSAQLARQLPAQLPRGQGQTRVEVLNASANSWGPRHELGYIRKYGQFGAQVVIQLINTDDLFAIEPVPFQVGRDRNYPHRKPLLAVGELIERAIAKPRPIPELESVRKQPGDRVGANLEAIRQLQQQATAEGWVYILAMTPLTRELGEPGPRDYEIKARQRLMTLTHSEGIAYIDFLPLFNLAAQPEALFRDNIHLSPAGYDLVREVLVQDLIRSLYDSADLAQHPPDGDRQPIADVEDDLWA